MEYKKLFDEKNEIIYLWINGEIDLNEMLKLQDIILDTKNLPSTLRILEISTRAISLLSVNDVELALNAMNEKTKRFKFVKHAVIQDSPINTAHTILAELYADRRYYAVKVFSTEEAAKIWLKM